jgi:CBS domain-containing protein
MKIRTILATKGTAVLTIGPEQSLTDAVALLAQHRIGALVVVDQGGAPIGIISERDIVRELARTESIAGLLVRQVMTQHVVIASPRDDIQSLSQTMTEHHFRHVPIVDEGTLIGIVSIGDVVKAQLENYQGEIDTLQTQMAADQA